MKGVVVRVVALGLIASLAACGGDKTPPPPAPTYSITATVSGLNAAGLVLQNGASQITVASGAASASIATGAANGTTYAVSVQTQPTGQTCTIASGSGTIASANVTSIAVTCVSPARTIGGAVSGLSGTVVLQNSGADNLSVAASGSFTFATSIASGTAYAVTVLTQPAGQTCTVASGTGTANANVSNVAVTCTTNNVTRTIGGTVSGLGGTIVLRNNGGDNLIVIANGNFTFPTAIADGAAYAVTAFTQPAGQTCSVANGSGTANANVTTVTVTCAANLTIGGSVSGLNGTLVLQNNLGDNLSISANGSFTFPNGVAANGFYVVSVLTPPTAQTCAVANPTGTTTNVDVTNITVTCANYPAAVTLGANVSGLTGTLVLQINGGDNLTVITTGQHLFATALAPGTPFVMSVLTQPAGQTCQIFSIAPAVVQPIAAQNVFPVGCVNGSVTYTVGGTINGLHAAGLKLFMNPNNGALSPAANATTFTFPVGLAPNTGFNVNVVAQPTGESCVATHYGGQISTTDVNGVVVTCIDNTTDPLAGTFAINGDSHELITFFLDGSYTMGTHEDDPTCGPGNGNGVELGIYSYNQTTHAFAIKSAVLDTNGACGVWDNGTGAVGALVKTGLGQGAVLNFTPNTSNTSPVSLIPVKSLALTPWGAFFPPLQRSFVVLDPDGHHLIAEVNQPVTGGTNTAGIEYGCYTTTQVGNVYTVSPSGPPGCAGAVDTNGSSGFSENYGGTFPYTVLTTYLNSIGTGASFVLLIRLVPN
jgi:hypothetical protein